MHTRGGLFGLDRVVELEVDEGVGTASELGRQWPLTLDDDQAGRLSAAAEHLIGTPVVDTGGSQGAVDAGVSEIRIDDRGRRTSLLVPTGAEAPDEVWALLEVVEEVCEAQRPA